MRLMKLISDIHIWGIGLTSELTLIYFLSTFNGRTVHNVQLEVLSYSSGIPSGQKICLIFQSWQAAIFVTNQFLHICQSISFIFANKISSIFQKQLPCKSTLNTTTQTHKFKRYNLDKYISERRSNLLGIDFGNQMSGGPVNPA